MRAVTFIFMVSLLACNQSSEPGAPDECSGESCKGIYGSSDQNPFLLERIYTNARDIAISWAENPAVSDWVLNIASDQGCASIQKSVTVAGATSTHLLDLEEGIWYLCLRSVSSPREIVVAPASQLLVVDRQGPKIEGETAQSLASGYPAIVKVSDLTDTKCSWTSTDEALRITDVNDVLSPFSTAVSGTYNATLSCQDKAENNSALAFTLTVSAGTSVTTPGQPQNVKALKADPSTNAIALSWTDGGDGVSYLVLESTAVITAAPADGMVYTVGSMIGAAKVKAVGNALTFNDTALAGNSLHYYKVFAANAAGRYASGSEASATALALKTLKATFSRTGSLTFNEAIGHRTVGTFTYLCRGDDGLSIINVANPADPRTVGNPVGLGNNTSGWCSDVKIQGNYAYVADWERGLIVVDITNPNAPQQKGSLPLTNASVVFVEGNFAYVALEDDGTGGGFAIVNITNPNSLTLVGTIVSTNGNAAGIAKIGNYIYLTHRNTGNNAGLRVYDITNPTNVSSSPVKQFSRTSAEEIEVVGGYAYVTVGTAGLEIFDVTNPANPTSKGQSLLPNNGFANSVRVQDNYAFVTASDASRLFVFDVTNKVGNLQSIRSYTTLDRASWVDVVGGNAYITSQRGGYEVVEVFQFQ